MCQINSQALGQSGQVCGCAVPTAWPQHRHKHRLWLVTEPPPGTQPSVQLLHTPELGQRSGEDPLPITRAGCHLLRCWESRVPPCSPIVRFCVSCLSLFSQGFLVLLLQAYLTWHCFISCVFSPKDT